MSFTEDIISNVKSKTPVMKKYPHSKKTKGLSNRTMIENDLSGFFFSSTTWVLAKYLRGGNSIIGITI